MLRPRRRQAPKSIVSLKNHLLFLVEARTQGRQWRILGYAAMHKLTLLGRRASTPFLNGLERLQGVLERSARVLSGGNQRLIRSVPLVAASVDPGLIGRGEGSKPVSLPPPPALRSRFGAASRDEVLGKRVPRHGCEAATAGRFGLSPVSLRHFAEPRPSRVIRRLAEAYPLRTGGSCSFGEDATGHPTRAQVNRRG